MEIPYSFPYIEGIKLDYDSFLRRIYRYLWRTTENCGLTYAREIGYGDNPVANVNNVKMVNDMIKKAHRDFKMKKYRCVFYVGIIIIPQSENYMKEK